MRKIIPLNFGWKYSPEFDEKMLSADYDDSAFETVDIPHANNEIPYNYFDEKIYQFVSCYRKVFTLEKGDLDGGKRVFIRFEGAANYAEVFVGGKPAGSHKGGYTPFCFDVTELVVPGENTVSVKLDSTERPEIPPFGNVVDYLCYGGIYREVSIEIFDPVYISDVFVYTAKDLEPVKQVFAEVTFSEAVSGQVSISMEDGDRVVYSRDADISGTVVRLGFTVSGVKLWDIDSPQLYALRISFGGDEVVKRFGFREAVFEKDGFKLNGRRLKLRGLNRHQSYPYVGPAMPASVQRADAELLKNRLGCNFVRTAHYPDSIHFLDRCDEIGLLVFTEMPSWQFLGEGEWRENCLDNIRSMIVRDRSHPSVILWGVRVNEGQDCDEFYTQTNALARKLDPTRQTGGVRNFPRSHLLEDVYTFNDFSHSGGKVVLLPPTAVCGNAPYLVTENNGHMFPTKSFDNEELRTEHALRHARVQNASYGDDRISGATGWCMADYNTHKDFGSGDRICYHGVTDMFRIPKLAAAVYASQQDDFTVMETSSTMDIGDHPAGVLGPVYIFTNCDFVKVYRNGEYKSTAYPDRKRFPNLPHPPICPEDYIGEALIKDEGLNKSAATALKSALIVVSKNGFGVPPQHYLKAAYAFVASKMSMHEFIGVCEKYFASWGQSQLEYRFEGYKNGELVATVTRSAVTSVDFTAKADSEILCVGDTYDATRIELTAVDQYGNRLPYSNAAVKVKATGPVSVIGPDVFSLIGGARAFWVRTTGGAGKARLKIDVEGMGSKTVDIQVKK